LFVGACVFVCVFACFCVRLCACAVSECSWDVLVFLCVCLCPVRACAGGRGRVASIRTRQNRKITTNQGKRVCRLPEWFVCRFVLMRRRRKERSSRTESTRGILRVLERSLPYRVQSHRSNAAHGTACLLRFRASPTPSSMHNSHTNTLTLPPTVAPSRPLCARRPTDDGPVVCSRASLGTCAVVQVGGTSVVQINVVRACDGVTRTVHVDVRVRSLEALMRSPACGSSVVRVCCLTKQNSG
jgi:hypothetical protein